MTTERFVFFDAHTHLQVEVGLLELVQREDDLAHRLERVLSFWPFGERLRERVFHERKVAEEDVFLAREVGEDRPRRDVRRLRDLRQGRGVVAALGEELARGAGDRLARPLLLTLP